jgi:hypothetical protein
MKHRVSELEGTLLDAAVAKAEGVNLIDRAVFRDGMREVYSSAGVFRDNYDPSTSWALGGPIIEREHITVAAVPAGPDAPLEWMGVMNYSVAGAERSRAFGSTPLIAAMRSYVASKFGEEVELP